MSPLFLLCYITYTTFTSIIFSLLLAFRLLCRRVSAPAGGPNEKGNIVALYEGTVFHQRRHPVRNSFRLPARYALIDLNRPPYAPPNYLSADDARRVAKTNGPVFLLRIPASVGYERSPVNLYYCYDIQGSTTTLKKCIVEDMLGNWKLKVNEPGEILYAIISVQHPKLGNYFTASFTAKRVIYDSTTSDDLEAFFWLMPHKVSITAYWNALKLWWNNVPFYTHPRIENPTYREEAFQRDEKMQLICPAFGGINKANNNLRSGGKIDRCFMWKDAKWPWSYLIR
ncbi:hypothetical protein DH2020_020210 [Rehmannia glutinosa]|uniref:Uncharacterized protein n=1 Tax=Rehmannia glutinosa TaxID=99300 RepID=A0ABR0WID5_REHGL